MTTPRIVITRRLPPAIEEAAARQFNVLANPEDTILGADEIVARAIAHQADGLLITLTAKFTGRPVPWVVT